MSLHRVLPVFFAVAMAAAAARATTADDVCAPSANPCVVPQGTTVNVTDGSVLDFGARALVLSPGSGTRLDAGRGTMAILAASVTLNPGSALLARGGAISVATSGAIAVLRSGTSKARIDTSDFTSPGAIALDAGGTIEVQGVVTAQGTGAESGAGGISVTAMSDVVISGDLIASGGGAGFGGDVSIGAPLGNFLLTGVIDVTGGDGGSVDVITGAALTTQASGAARIDAKSTGAEGDGGTVDLLSTGGDVSVGTPMWAQGSTGIDFGGSGGDVSVEASLGTVTLAGTINQSGASPDGDGGDLDVMAGFDIVQTGAITSNGRSASGVGGAVDFYAERAATVGSIEASGLCTTCAGGDVTVNAWCSVTVPAGANVTVDGSGGMVYLQSGGDLDVHGFVRAGQAISLFHRLAANPPDTTGAIFQPAPVVKLAPQLIGCGGPPGINCGNDVLDEGETCDDGNKVGCDGCSPICVVESCGDGWVGCDQFGRVEACDDGNTTSCDGCAADCSRRDRICGDGVKECGEECDSGPAADCDAGQCSAQCRVERCGNGRTECNEQCDDGGPTPSCDAMCVLLAPPTCGNGTLEAGEVCDDGNTADCDGCSHLCQVEACGNGVLECGETCDDFNADPCDGCDALCQAEVCGNGTVDCGESCDEGDQNGQPGSACLAEVCEPGEICTVDSTGPCIPCADALACDPLGLCAGTACVDGVCTPTTIECTSDDPCEVGTCDAARGCVYEPVLGFDSVRCRLDDLEVTVAAGPGVSIVAQAALGKHVDKAKEKLDAAEGGVELGNSAKAKRSLKSGRKQVKKLGKKIVRLQPKHITDPAVGSALTDKAADLAVRWDGLRSGLGL